MTDDNQEAWERWLHTRLREFQTHLFRVIGPSTGAEHRKLRAEMEQLRISSERHTEREIASAARELRASVRGLVRKELIDVGLFKIARHKDAGRNSAWTRLIWGGGPSEIKWGRGSSLGAGASWFCYICQKLPVF
jgi:hypothetical protein